ncbi:nucleoporin NUP42 isoform X2 [Dromiciops gliroides]|nr:nucleoporin NUP42 isoform X2 [Dromiciops gliroides]
MEVWESSGQWMFSVYSPMKEKPNISGFTDISPEELRLEYSNYITSNNLQSYLNSIQQLVNLWKNRLLELKNINTATKGALLSKLKNEENPAVPTFGFQNQETSTFGSTGFPVNSSSSSGVQNFTFKPASGLGGTPPSSSSSSSSTSVFGSQALTAASSSNSTMTSPAPTSFGFGEPAAAVSAASFFFKSPEVFSFGSAGFSGFPASSPLGTAGATGSPAFGGGAFGSSGPSGASGASLFGLPTSTFGHSGTPSSLSSSGGTNAAEQLFTPKNELTAEELKQFAAKKFTLGKVPLKPPPEGLLSV